MTLGQLPDGGQQRARAQRLSLDRQGEALHNLFDQRRSGAPVALEVQFDHGQDEKGGRGERPK
jgi:hypothetical protein